MMIEEVGRDRGGNPVTGENGETREKEKKKKNVGEGVIDREELREMNILALVYFEHI